MEPPDSKPTPLETVALQGGVSIANSILARVEDFPQRESLLNSWMEHELESVPTQILWHGMEDEAAPVFVVYKLIHETFSNSPPFFRRFITSVMEAQPKRFSSVFSRETLWSVVARAPKHDFPAEWASPGCIRCMLEAMNKKSFWRRSDEELARDADSISAKLMKDGDGGFRKGVEALRQLQAERATGLTQGHLMLLVPAKLNQYVTEVAEHGMRGKLPSLKEMCGKVHEIVRDPAGEGRHQSIPIDVLFSEPDGDSMDCFLLAREKANATEQVELRKKSLLVRYFLKFAFTAYDIEKLNVRFAFYLDPGTTFKALPDDGQLFHPEELVQFDEFWKIITGNPNGAQLIFKARDSAAAKLKASTLMKRIKEHFGRERKGKPSIQVSLFPAA